MIADPAKVGLAEEPGNRISAGGRGLSRQQAFRGCVGELAEKVAARETPNDPRVVKGGFRLDEANFEAKNRRWLLNGLGLSPEARKGLVLDGIEGRCFVTGRPVMLPAEAVLWRRSEARACPRRPHSTGLAAGPDIASAERSALLEIIERDAYALWWYGGGSAIRFHLDRHRWPEATRIVRSTRSSKASRDVFFLLLASDFPVPVVACCSAFQDGGTAIIGLAAALSPEDAVIRSYLELCQMEFAYHLAVEKMTHLGEGRLQPTDRLWIARGKAITVSALPNIVAPDTGPVQTAPADWPQIQACLTEKRHLTIASALTKSAADPPVARVSCFGMQGPDPEWATARLRYKSLRTGVRIKDRMKVVAPL
ncbi:MAG: YcaO-like family protein [Alphaproteobacteria bacterium]|nr:YcaO-like family protein [Alphaproteobacteria bacterium]